MYLLIRSRKRQTWSTMSSFTSHYVSINSSFRSRFFIGMYQFTSHYVSINSLCSWSLISNSFLNLHPTMYLLIPVKIYWCLLYLQYLHPTMYLLIPNKASTWKSGQNRFTSHYVSINSAMGGRTFVSVKIIYIPLCIY